MEHKNWAGFVAGTAWLLGRSAAAHERELAERALSASERAQHAERAATLSIASTAGAAYVLYESFKAHPKLTATGLFIYFGGAAFVSWASTPNRYNTPSLGQHPFPVDSYMNEGVFAQR